MPFTPCPASVDASYPWAAHTPEASPRQWSAVPFSESGSTKFAAPAPLTSEILRTACDTTFEHMCYRISADCSAYQMPSEPAAAREVLRRMCEPFFEQMITSLHQQLNVPEVTSSMESMQVRSQQMSGACLQPLFYHSGLASYHDELSTDANESCAFSSVFSGPSSEGECLDAHEKNSEASAPSSDAERSVMVCRHWKSKGWCRLDSKCKFLHPEDKRGVCAPKASGNSDAGDEFSVALSMSSQRTKKKRGGKSRSIRGQQQHADEACHEIASFC